MWKSTRQLFAPSCELLALAQVVFFAFFGTAGSELSNGLSLILSPVKFFRRGFGTREDLFLAKKMAAEEPAVRRLYWVWRRDDGVWLAIYRSAKVRQTP